MEKLALLVLLGSFVGVAPAAQFSVSSPDVRVNAAIGPEQVFNGFGCTGGNISPALQWFNPPASTKSFAVTMYDPDAPTGSGWWHWVMFNIPASAKGLAKNAGSIPAKLAPADAIQSRTDFNQPGYGGPCPPKGDKPHRYIFSVYALKVDKLPLDENAPAAMVGFYLHQNTIDKAMFRTKYGR
jgi:Raf kinase inhibitor-like YbhB/YbcL family protein